MVIIAEQVKTRIAEVVAELNFVGGAAEFASLKDIVFSFPAVFVVTLNETGGANTLAAMAAEQIRTQQFGIIFAVQNVSDASGEEAINDLQTMRLKIDDALTGWSPQLVDSINSLHAYFFKPIICVDPVMFSRGQLLAMVDGVVWWQDVYTTNYLRRS